MEDKEDIRWRQRFENYQKALKLLKDLAARQDLSMAEQAGLIQYFEMVFELGWKTIKDILEKDGVNFIPTPKSTLREAFRAGLIRDAHTWIDAVEERNNTVHTYEESKAAEVEQKIRASFLPVFIELENDLTHYSG